MITDSPMRDTSTADLTSTAVNMDGPRRSRRKREEKSYAESPDLIIEEDRSLPSASSSPSKAFSGASRDFFVKGSHQNSHDLIGNSSNCNVIGNGDVHMESEDDEEEQEEDEISAPVDVIPLPKVSIYFC